MTRLHSDGKELFADCYFSGTQQRLFRVLSWLSAKKKVVGAAKWRWWRLYRVSWRLGTRQNLNVFAECNKIYPTNSLLLDRVPLTRQSSDVRYWVQHSASTCLFFAKCICLPSIFNFFAKCILSCTQQIGYFAVCFFCGVFYFLHSANMFFAECPMECTRQTTKHSANVGFPLVNRMPSQKTSWPPDQQFRTSQKARSQSAYLSSALS